MLERLKNIKGVIILAVWISGLSTILLETMLGPRLHQGISLTVRSVFWISALLYITVRVSDRLNRKLDKGSESK